MERTEIVFPDICMESCPGWTWESETLIGVLLKAVPTAADKPRRTTSQLKICSESVCNDDGQGGGPIWGLTWNFEEMEWFLRPIRHVVRSFGLDARS